MAHRSFLFPPSIHHFRRDCFFRMYRDNDYFSCRITDLSMANKLIPALCSQPSETLLCEEVMSSGALVV